VLQKAKFLVGFTSTVLGQTAQKIDDLVANATLQLSVAQYMGLSDNKRSNEDNK
jgi:hypothetical protein